MSSLIPSVDVASFPVSVRLWLGDGLKQHINSVYNGNPSVLVTVHKHCIFYNVQGETSRLIYTHICSICVWSFYLNIYKIGIWLYLGWFALIRKMLSIASFLRSKWEKICSIHRCVLIICTYTNIVTRV